MAAAVVTAARTKATPNRLVMTLTSDGGETAATTIPNATLVSRTLGSGDTPGPLLKTFQATYASQAALRLVMPGGNVSVKIQARTLSSAWLVDTNVSSSLPVIEVTPPDDLAAVAYLYVDYLHSSTR